MKFFGENKYSKGGNFLRKSNIFTKIGLSLSLLPTMTSFGVAQTKLKDPKKAPTQVSKTIALPNQKNQKKISTAPITVSVEVEALSILKKIESDFEKLYKPEERKSNYGIFLSYSLREFLKKETDTRTEYILNEIFEQLLKNKKEYLNDEYVQNVLLKIIMQNSVFGTNFFKQINSFLEIADFDNIIITIRLKDIFRQLCLFGISADERGQFNYPYIHFYFKGFTEAMKKNPKMDFEKIFNFYIQNMHALKIDGVEVASPYSKITSPISQTVSRDFRFKKIENVREGGRISGGLGLSFSDLAEVLLSLWPEKFVDEYKKIDKKWSDVEEIFKSPEFANLGGGNIKRAVFLIGFTKYKFGKFFGKREFLDEYNFEKIFAYATKERFSKYFSPLESIILKDSLISSFIAIFPTFNSDISVADLKLAKKIVEQKVKTSQVSIWDFSLVDFYDKNWDSREENVRELANAFMEMTSPYVDLVLRDRKYAYGVKLNWFEYENGIKNDPALKDFLVVHKYLKTLPVYSPFNKGELAEISAIVARNLFFRKMEFSEQNVAKIIAEREKELFTFGNFEIYGGKTILVANDETLRPGISKFTNERFGTDAFQKSLKDVSPGGLEFLSAKVLPAFTIPGILRELIINTDKKITINFDGHGNSEIREVKQVSGGERKYETNTSFDFADDKNNPGKSLKIKMEEMADSFVERYRNKNHRLNSFKNPDVLVLMNCYGNTLRDFADHYNKKMLAAGVPVQEIPNIIVLTETEYGQLGLSDYTTPHHTKYPEAVLGLNPMEIVKNSIKVKDVILNDENYRKSNPTMYIVGPKMMQLSSVEETKKA